MVTLPEPPQALPTPPYSTSCHPLQLFLWTGQEGLALNNSDENNKARPPRPHVRALTMGQADMISLRSFSSPRL